MDAEEAAAMSFNDPTCESTPPRIVKTEDGPK